MILLTISLSFSFSALTAFFLLTLACAITSSMSFCSSPESSTSSPSSSSSSAFLPASLSMALPLSPSALWSWPACSFADCAASCCAAEAWAWELRSSILASPKMLQIYISDRSTFRGYSVSALVRLGDTHIQVLLLGLL